MINFILGFITWPLLGFTVVAIHNLICRIKQLHPIAYLDLWFGWLGPIAIVTELIVYFKNKDDYKW